MAGRTKINIKAPERNLTHKVVQTKKDDSSQPVSSPADRILFLQRTVGNKALQRLFKSGMIQAKLKIGEPNDIYEQEADRVADQVMRMPDRAVGSQQSAVSSGNERIQRKPT